MASDILLYQVGIKKLCCFIWNSVLNFVYIWLYRLWDYAKVLVSRLQKEDCLVLNFCNTGCHVSPWSSYIYLSLRGYCGICLFTLFFNNIFYNYPNMHEAWLLVIAACFCSQILSQLVRIRSSIWSWHVSWLSVLITYMEEESGRNWEGMKCINLLKTLYIFSGCNHIFNSLILAITIMNLIPSIFVTGEVVRFLRWSLLLDSWLTLFTWAYEVSQLMEQLWPEWVYQCRFLSPLFHQLEPEWCHLPMVFQRLLVI